MKKIYLLLSFILLTSIVNAQFPAPYCAEAYSFGVEPITSVVFNTINKTSSATTTGATAHEDNTSISTTLVVGGNYSISIQGNTDGAFMDYVRVFIDWDQNGDFTGTDESYDIGILNSSTGIDGQTITASITIPTTATVGTTRMRVTKKYNAFQTPCNTAGYGQSEDYTVNIAAATACTGTPTAGTASAPAQACSGSNFALSLAGSTVADGIHYQWQTTTVGGSSWANIPNDTTTLVYILQGTAGADYRCVITCTNSGISVNSNVVTVALQTVGCPPPNDDVCNAITLVLDGAADCQNTTNATSINDPVSFTCSSPNNTTWYKYTPTTSGLVQFTFTQPASGDVLNGWLGAYTLTGTCPGVQVFTDVTTAVFGTCKSFGTTGGGTAYFTGNLLAGTDYYFMIDGVIGDVGQYCISIQTPPSPPATCATNTLPVNAATSVTNTPAVVLRWTAVAGATSYDVYHGTANPPTTVTTTSSTDSALIAGTAYNTTYYWYVVPKNGGGSATGCDANITSYTTGGVPATAANDDACDAITLVLDGPSDCKNSTFATSVSDPSYACFTPNNTLWYKYTPATSGNVQFTFTPPASGDTLNGWLGVFTASGTCPGSLTFTDVTTATLGACHSFGQNGNANTQFNANLTAGTEYYFMIDGVGGDIGEYCISIQTPPPPPVTCPTNISPANNAIDVATAGTYIRWSPVAGAASYDVYFGTTNPPTTAIGNSVIDSTLITGMAYATTYYWYIVPKNGGGSATGCDANTTSFTTVAAPPPPANDDCSGALTIGTTPVLSTTVSATLSQPGEACAGSTGTADDDVWFTFTATQNGSATITETPTVNSNLDGVIIVYSGSCGSFTTIGCADATFSGDPEVVTVTGLVAGQTYYVRVYSWGSATSGQGEFNITAVGTALPVSITKFIGERKGSTNILSWSTATETNNKGFELQRSATGDNFLPLTFVESKATNGSSSSIINYQATDNKPYSGNTFYRLKQVDKNGKASFSNIISIKGDKINNLGITDIYPNPASSLLNMVISSPNNEKVNVIITDITGKILQNESAQVTNGNNNIKLNVSNLAAGSYMLKLVCSNGCTSAVTKFVKQ